MLIYFGSNTSYDPQSDLNSGHAVKVFDTLMEPLRTTDPHIFADRFYRTYELVRHLSERETFYTGTVNINRKNFPPQLKTLKLNHLDQRWYIQESPGNNMLCVSWKDKKSKKGVIIVSTKADVQKPTVVHDYNLHINGCDRMDQSLTYYGQYNRKTVKCWKKIFHWSLEVAQCNAHILFNLSRPVGTKPISLSSFKDMLIEQLIAAAAEITPEDVRNAKDVHLCLGML